MALRADCRTFVSHFIQLYGSKACVSGLIEINLSLICMAVRLRWADHHTFVSCLYRSILRFGWTNCHTFVSYFRGFQMSAISRVFDQEL